MPRRVEPRVRFRERDEDRDDRKHQSIIEATLNVEPLSYSHRDAPVSHHGLTEGSIRRSEDCRDQRSFEHRQVGQNDCPNQCPDDNGERQANSEHPRGNCQLGAKDPKVDASGVDEQDQYQRRLSE